jgi:hypothetical protein
MENAGAPQVALVWRSSRISKNATLIAFLKQNLELGTIISLN